ncbi:MAG: hypothetical protein GXP63_01615 [DPANN group archaeon]|nr:hypothetical protein [DPANN group archaeon]
MSTAEETEHYIEQHKSIKDALLAGVINYSALARKIAEDLGKHKKTSKEAILVAAIRYGQKIKGQKRREHAITALLSASHLEIKNKVAVLTLEKSVFQDHLTALQKKVKRQEDVFFSIDGTKSITLILSGAYVGEARKLFKGRILSIKTATTVVIIKSEESIEDIPGVLGYIASRFADHDVNIIECMSCWTDTILIVKDEDVPKVMEFMSF